MLRYYHGDVVFFIELSANNKALDTNYTFFRYAFSILKYKDI